MGAALSSLRGTRWPRLWNWLEDNGKQQNHGVRTMTGDFGYGKTGYGAGSGSDRVAPTITPSEEPGCYRCGFRTVRLATSRTGIAN